MNNLIQSFVKAITTIFKKEVVVSNKTVVSNNPEVVEKKVSKIGITEEDYKNAARSLGCDVEAIKAFAKVESRGSGFLSDGRPVILFERHILHSLLKQKGMTCEDKSICATKASGWNDCREEMLAAAPKSEGK